MFGTAGGWPISPTDYTLQLTVGGIATKPGYPDGEGETWERKVEPSEYLSVTFDDDVVDGAPVARFVQRLGEAVEVCHGLEEDAE